MPINMGIHRQPIGRVYLAFLDFHMRGNDGGLFVLRKRLSSAKLYCSWAIATCHTLSS